MRSRIERALGWAIICCLTIAASTATLRAADEPLRIDTGLISGGRSSVESKVRVYKGVPFAAPPVGKLRWQPPQPVAAWQGVRECSQFSAICPQSPYPPTSIYASRRNHRARIACISMSGRRPSARTRNDP